jgi:hypothetical protein
MRRKRKLLKLDCRNTVENILNSNVKVNRIKLALIQNNAKVLSVFCKDAGIIPVYVLPIENVLIS